MKANGGLAEVILTALAAFVLISFTAAAATAAEGQPCMSEPTDEFISYGDIRTCTISPVGDSDLYRFVGATGETIVVHGVEGDPFSLSPDVCLELFRPDGSPVGAIVCNEVAAVIQTPLDASGVFTIRVTEAGNDQTMGYNLVLERLHPVSPTATPIISGIQKTGETIDPVGDIDFYIFQGTAGDTISLVAVEGDPFSLSPDVCIELFRPDGTQVGSPVCGEVSATIGSTLDQTGEFLVRVTEAGNDQIMTYNLEYQCLFGSCDTLKRPICDIQLNQASYVVGDPVTVSEFRLANPGTESVPLEIKVWLKVPTNPPIRVINVGADGSFVMPPGYDVNFGPFNLFTLGPNFPLGNYEFSCRMQDPVTGELKTVDINPFKVEAQ